MRSLRFAQGYLAYGRDREIFGGRGNRGRSSGFAGGRWGSDEVVEGQAKVVGVLGSEFLDLEFSNLFFLCPLLAEKERKKERRKDERNNRDRVPISIT